VRITTELADAVEPVEGQTYIVTAVEEIKTAVQTFAGLRVSLEPEKRKKDDENDYATMLWSRDVAGIRSKLGAFISAFLEFFDDEEKAMETDNWKGHKVRIVSWKSKDREIQVLE
jgi:hypothetical protein